MPVTSAPERAAKARSRGCSPREGLAALDPALVIVQAGHDDAGVPPGIERDRVRQAIALIRAELPHALIALLTVFTGRSPSRPAELFQTDAAIIAGALAADPAAIIMDPLAGRWDYQHFDGGLHPTAAGDTWIAGKVAEILRAHGVLPADAGGRSPDDLRRRRRRRPAPRR